MSARRRFTEIAVVTIVLVLLISCPPPTGPGIDDTVPPADVTELTTTTGNESVVISWTDPTDPDIDYVRIEHDGDTDAAMMVEPGTQNAVVTGLEGGRAYSFTITVVDEAGNSSVGRTATATPEGPDPGDITPPDNVTELSSFSGNGSVALSWTDPTDSDIAYVRIGHDGEAGAAVVIDPGVETAVLAGLENDREYVFTFVVYDSSGNASDGATYAATPGIPEETDTQAPGEVTALTAEAGPQQVSLSWGEPTDPDLMRILITHDQVDGSTPLTVQPGHGAAVIGGLDEALTYTFTVHTEDLAGNVSTGVTVTETPDSPEDTVPPGSVTDLSASAGNGQATLTWSNPTDLDLSHIEITDDGDIAFSVSSSKQSVTIGGLANATEYTFSVVVVDTTLNRSATETVAVTPEESPIDTTPPTEVTAPSATAGNGQVTISWGDPDVDDLDHIVVTNADTGQKMVIPAGRGSVVVAGLTNGVAYEYRISAVDIWANESSGETVAFTPSGSDDTTPPDAVSGLDATPGDRSITLSWSEPDTDVAVIEVINTTENETFLIPADSGGVVLGGLNNGTTYEFEVTVLDAAGNRSAARTTNGAPVDTSDGTPPEEVDTLTLTAGDRLVDLSWNDPGDDDLDHVTVRNNTTGEELVVAAESESVRVGGIENNTEYSFTVRTVDVNGNVSTGVTDSATPFDPRDSTPPAVPTEVTASPGDELVTVSWRNPADSDLSHVIITGTPSVSDMTIPVSTDEIGGPAVAVVAGLTNGEEYTFTVTAVDLTLNASDASGSSSATPAEGGDSDPPAQPTSFTATAGDGYVDLSWTNPSDDDFSHTEITNNQNGDLLYVPGAPDAAGTIRISGLTNEVSYTFYARSADDSGNLASAVSDTATPTDGSDVTAPGTVTDVSTEVGDGRVTLSWNNPGDLDLEFIRILVEETIGGADVAEVYVPASLTSAVITGLTNGVGYDFTLTAIDGEGNESSGTGSASTPAADTTPPDDVVIGSTTAGDGQVTITWTDPSGTGNEDFTSVRITNDVNAEAIVIPAGVEITIIAGLTNDQAYTFTLESVDAVGNASSGMTTTATPSFSGDLTPTDPVSSLDYVESPPEAIDSQATLVWSDPSGTGNEDLDHIEVECAQFPPGAVTVVEAGVQTVTFAGLVNGDQYDFTVYAVDDAGNRSSGEALSMTPSGSLDFVEPAPVTSFNAASGDGFVTLTWDDPGDTDLSYVRITNDVTSDIIFVPGGIQAAIIGGLTNGQSYTFTARAVDTSNNQSDPASDSATPISGTDGTAPQDVTALEAAPGDGKVVLSWTDPDDSDLNHIKVTHDQTGGSNPVVVAAGAESVAIFGLTNGTPHEFTVKAVDEAGNVSSPGATVTATPVNSFDDFDVVITVDTPDDETVVTTGQEAILYTGESPTAMTVTATLTDATAWTWYLDGVEIHSGSNQTTVSTSYSSPSPPYPLAAGVHSLVVAAEKDGMPYTAEVDFEVRNNL